MFRVVPDQLRISEGWVRCGHCDEVFDANAHLRSLEDPATVTPPAPQAYETNVAQASPTDFEAVPPASEPINDWGPLIETHAEQPETSAEIPLQDVAHAVAPENDSHPGVLLHRAAFEIPTSAELEDAHFAHTTVQDWPFEPLVTQEGDSAPNASAKDDATPSFMPRSQKRTGLNRYMGRTAMISVALALALLLTAQFLFFERNRLTASSSALRPLLATGCEMLGCTISPPRQIESIAIDSSAFTHLKSGVYNLSLSLRNGGSIDLAAPALELTLTDLQDQVLARRVLLPREYSAKTLIAARAELQASLPIAVRADGVSEKISGYKLLAFYP
jgi:predicted Zn finger-like uncharacterized protein